MRKGTVAFIALGVLAILATPASANSPWFVGVELKFLSPTDTATDYTVVDADQDFVLEGDLRSVDLDTELTPMIFFGQVGSDGSGWWVGYQAYDGDSTDAATAPVGGAIWDSLYPPTFSFSQLDDGSATARASLETSTIDAAFFQPILTKDTYSIHWWGGLRIAALEQSLDVSYSTAGATFTEFVSSSSEVDGIGLTGGVWGTTRINDRFDITGTIGYSILAGGADTTIDAFDSGAFTALDLTRDEDRVFTILESSVKVGYLVRPELRIWAGLDYAKWFDALDRINTPDDVNPSNVVVTTSDVGFSGFGIGASYMFGGGS